MSIEIGNNNKIKNSIIAEKMSKNSEEKKKTFYDRHPAICGFIISLAAGIVLLFSFWEQIIGFIEGVL